MTKIQWCDDVWNPLAGCTPVSPGCANCYAATMAKRLAAMGVEKYKGTVDRHGKWTGKITLDNDALTIPLRRSKPTRYFVNSMSDLFHEAVPFEFVDRVFAVMALCSQHMFQVLTKRPERMAEYLANGYCNRVGSQIKRTANGNVAAEIVAIDIWHQLTIGGLPNVWLGTSVENQQCANERIPHLLRCPAAVRFLSCEPLLGPLDLTSIPFLDGNPRNRKNVLTGQGDFVAVTDDGQEFMVRTELPVPMSHLHWVIVGGESGPRARPCNVAWIRGVRDQCAAAGAPVFVKQLGANVRDRNDSDFLNGVWVEGQLSRGWPNLDPANVEHDLDGTHDGYQGAPVRVHLSDPKGGDMSEWPEDLRVREMPEVDG